MVTELFGRAIRHQRLTGKACVPGYLAFKQYTIVEWHVEIMADQGECYEPTIGERDFWVIGDDSILIYMGGTIEIKASDSADTFQGVLDVGLKIDDAVNGALWFTHIMNSSLGTDIGYREKSRAWNVHVPGLNIPLTELNTLSFGAKLCNESASGEPAISGIISMVCHLIEK